MPVNRGIRVGAAVFIAGVSLAWPQAIGVAAADDDLSAVSTVPGDTAQSVSADRRPATRPTRSRPAPSGDRVPGTARSARTVAAVNSALPPRVADRESSAVRAPGGTDRTGARPRVAVSVVPPTAG